jgi:hypothetical protein
LPYRSLCFSRRYMDTRYTPRMKYPYKVEWPAGRSMASP